MAAQPTPFVDANAAAYDPYAVQAAGSGSVAPTGFDAAASTYAADPAAGYSQAVGGTSPQAGSVSGGGPEDFAPALAGLYHALASLGLDYGQIGFVKMSGLPAADLTKVVDAIKADPTIVAKIPGRNAGGQQWPIVGVRPYTDDELVKIAATELERLGVSQAQVAYLASVAATPSDLLAMTIALHNDPSLVASVPTSGAAAPTTTSTTAAAPGTDVAAGPANGPGTMPYERPATGKPAWNEEWRQKFIDAGAPPQLVQQLTYTGAMGADEAQLNAMLTELKGQIDAQLKEFETKHPKEYKALAGVKAIGRADLVQVAMAVNQGQVPDDKLKEFVDQASASPMAYMGKRLLLQLLPWTFIPGWGAIRFAASPFFGGKDPISGDPIHLDFWNHGFTGWMDAAMAVGGAMSLYNTAQGFMNVRNGLKLIDGAKGAGGLAEIAAREGVDNLTGMRRMLAYVPGSSANRAVTGLARFNNDLIAGIAKLKAGEGGVMGTRDFAQLVMDKWQKGEISVYSKSGFGSMPFGLGSDVRGSMPIFGNRGKAMFEWINEGGKTILKIDGRLTGEPLAAFFAAAGVNLAPAGALRASEAALLQNAGNVVARPPLQLLQNAVLGQAAREMGLQASGFAATPFGKAWSLWHPGPMEDALKAMSSPTGELSGLSKVLANPWAKRGLIGLGVFGVGGFFAHQQMQAAKQAEQGQQQGAGTEAQGATGQATAGAQAASADMQQAIATFKTLTPQEQAQFVQDQATQLQQAANQPNLTDEQKALIEQRFAELQMLVDSVSGAAAMQPQGAAVAPAAGTGAPSGVAEAQRQLAGIGG